MKPPLQDTGRVVTPVTLWYGNTTVHRWYASCQAGDWQCGNTTVSPPVYHTLSDSHNLKYNLPI